ncbi:hypothetical protein [Ectothiorhodospira marina]|jgi:hypothetical protein|uniref:Uncharacterized protein n=1 Tax=Ectothiorhodospira marina TaxID=1396821 RepID=A0A1H7MBU2_9GAMM|nr:hypothetical protein [Ectothiorhodospira marina]SEL08632.1 hypothetical protein SAMN05444515_10937 [Ectothiorhodospira marina]
MAFSFVGILAVVLEFFRGWLWVLVPLVILDLVLLGLFFKRTVGRRRKFSLPFKSSLGFGVFTFVMALITLPGITRSSWEMLSGAVDYLALIGASVGFGVLFAILSFPVMLHLVGIGAKVKPEQQATRQTPPPAQKDSPTEPQGTAEPQQSQG